MASVELTDPEEDSSNQELWDLVAQYKALLDHKRQLLGDTGKDDEGSDSSDFSQKSLITKQLEALAQVDSMGDNFKDMCYISGVNSAEASAEIDGTIPFDIGDVQVPKIREDYTNTTLLSDVMELTKSLESCMRPNETLQKAVDSKPTEQLDSQFVPLLMTPEITEREEFGQTSLDYADRHISFHPPSFIDYSSSSPSGPIWPLPEKRRRTTTPLSIEAVDYIMRGPKLTDVLPSLSDANKDLLLELLKLDQIIHYAHYASKDDIIVEEIQHKESEAIDQITSAIEYHKSALEELYKQEREVRSLKQNKMDAFKQIEASLNEQVIIAETFSSKTKHETNFPHNNKMSIQKIMQMKQQCANLSSELLNQISFNREMCQLKSSDKYDPLSVRKRKTAQFGNSKTSQLGNYTTNVPDYTTLRFKSLTGSHGYKPEQFKKPISVVCTADQIIASDHLNDRIKFYDTNLNLQAVIGYRGSGQGQFCSPSGLAIGPGGEVFVVDLNNHRVVVLTAQGVYLRDFFTFGSGDDQVRYPQGIAARDDYVFIADTCNYRVKVVRTDGVFLCHFGSKGSDQGQFENFPISVAVMSPGDGRVLVNELGKRQLQVYSRTGEYQGLFPPTIPLQVESGKVNNMTVDSLNNIIITYNSGQLAVFNKSGDLITVVGSPGTQAGQFCYPDGVSVDIDNGHLVVCDCYKHRLQLYKFDVK